MNVRYALLFSLSLSACVKNATFEVQGDVAIMRGTIGSRTVRDVKALIEANPGLRQITLQDVPGSNDDNANLEASRAVRAAGLTTHVPADGVIASGGVDFFCAGVQRTVEPGAMLGVHSWSGGGSDGASLPREDPEHQLYLDYYEEMGIPEDFYWFTLEAAPASGIHWMTQDEIATHGLSTGQ